MTILEKKTIVAEDLNQHLQDSEANEALIANKKSAQQYHIARNTMDVGMGWADVGNLPDLSRSNLTEAETLRLI